MALLVDVPLSSPVFVSGPRHTVPGMVVTKISEFLLAHLDVRRHRGGPMGKTIFSECAISVREDLSPESRDCTLEHECRHIYYGPQPRGLRAKNEERIRRETAVAMLPNIRPIGDAIAWALSEEEAAHELGVDIYVLRYRLKHMSPMEVVWLNRRLERDDVVLQDWWEI